jgi:signal peptidase I
MASFKLQQQAATLIYLAISTLILALGIRTWLVMGLIAPVTVSGSSMAPTLLGPHVATRCPRCQLTIRIGAQWVPPTNPVHCPYCQEGRLDWTRAGNQPGSRLWIDRSSTLWRLPRRWEVVVFYYPWQTHYPGHAKILCTKRVLGLPGEQVRLAAGDVLINGQLQVKTLPEQRQLRQLVRRRPNPVSLPGDDSMTKKRALFPTDRPFTDEITYNGQLSRKLRLIHDFMLSAQLTCHGNGQLEWTVDDGQRPLRLHIRPTDGSIRILQQGRLLVAQTLSEPSRRRLARGEVYLELSTFDRQLLLAIDGRVELRHALKRGVSPAGTMEPFALTSSNLAVTLGNLTLWRDIYHGPRPVGIGSWGAAGSVKSVSNDRQAVWQLAADELFLVGDNGPVSIDSRVWPHAGIPRHLLVGRLMGGP